MRMLIYVGRSPSREDVIAYCAPLAERAATSLTLVAPEGQLALLEDAAARLGGAPELRLLPGSAQRAILAAAAERPYDLVAFGRLSRPLARLLPGRARRGRAIAARLEPSVLRVVGEARPIRRVLLASGGDHHTLRTARVAAQLVAPLGAEVTLLHVMSQQPLVFEGFGGHRPAPLAEPPGALREAAALLEAAGVAARAVVRRGPVIDEVLAELRASDYDLLVIGAHRVASALDRVLLEDITGDLLDAAPLPTLVVKGEAPPE